MDTTGPQEIPKPLPGAPLREAVPAKPKIAILGQDLGGLGDYALVERIQQFFLHTFGRKIPPENIQIFMDNYSKKDLSVIFPETEFHAVEDISRFGPDMVVTYECEDLREQVVREGKLRSGLPVVEWKEYGEQGSSGAVQTGLLGRASVAGSTRAREPEEGIFLDRELVEWSARVVDPKERLVALEGVSPGVQKAILGERAGARALARFTTSSRLFLGYCSERGIRQRGGRGSPAAVTYLISLAKMQRQMPRRSGNPDLQRKDMTIFLMGEHDILAESEVGYRAKRGGVSKEGDDELADLRRMVEEMGEEELVTVASRGSECSHSSLMQAHVQKELLQNGIGLLEVSRYDQATGQIVSAKYLPLQEMYPDVQVAAPSELKVMRVITGGVSHVDSKGLMMASEDEVLATGDAFLAEAISARKRFMYQQMHHKRFVAEGLKARFPGIHVHLEGHDYEYPPGEHPGDLFYQKRVHRKEHRRECDRVIKSCDLEKNVTPRIKRVVKAALGRGV
ncbi:hypothetical protein K0U07_04525 [bacterium]|nr:hypothetical protein [bacterium]